MTDTEKSAHPSSRSIGLNYAQTLLFSWKLKCGHLAS